jgi:hypothetical protein
VPVERPVPMEWGSIGKDSRADMDVDLSASDFLHDTLARAQPNPVMHPKKSPNTVWAWKRGLGLIPGQRTADLIFRHTGFKEILFLA